MNWNAKIKSSKKNLPSIALAVQTVRGQHPQAVQMMGGVNALAALILGVVSAGMITVGQALQAIGKAMPHIFPAMLQMLQTIQNAAKEDCRVALMQILQLLS